MNEEFHPNGHIEALIKKHGPGAAEVKEAIEFWGPDAGEFGREGTQIKHPDSVGAKGETCNNSLS